MALWMNAIQENKICTSFIHFCFWHIKLSAYYVLAIKKSIYEEDITNLLQRYLMTEFQNPWKAKLTEPKGEIDKVSMTMGDFNIHSWWLIKLVKIENIWTVKYFDLTDIYRTPHPAIAGCIFFSMYMLHLLGQVISWTIKQVSIHFKRFSLHKVHFLSTKEVHWKSLTEKSLEKNPNIWKLNNAFLNSPQAKDRIKTKNTTIKIYGTLQKQYLVGNL